MAESYDKEVFHLTENFKIEAEKLVLTEFPLIIIQLNSLLQTSKFTNRNINDLHENPAQNPEKFPESGDSSEPPLKKSKLDNKVKTKVLSDYCQSNKCVIDLIETIKPHLAKLVTDAKTVRMWIGYLIPKMEVCNNFEVVVQEETRKLVKHVEISAANFNEKITEYFISRAKIVIDVVKNPEVEDLRRAVNEIDKKEYHDFCLVMTEIYNHYCSLYDFLLKNLDKLKSPKPKQPQLFL